MHVLQLAIALVLGYGSINIQMMYCIAFDAVINTSDDVFMGDYFTCCLSVVKHPCTLSTVVSEVYFERRT